jgi:hypothetical protein
MKVVATRGRGNIESISVTETDPITQTTTDFIFAENNTTRVEVKAGGASISSDTTDVSFASNKIMMKLGKLELPEGKYDVKVIIFTATAPEGTEIVGPSRDANITLLMNAP